MNQETLKEYFAYDKDTGIFTWLKKPGVRANRVKVGSVAGSRKAIGYIETSLFGARYLMHRLAWLYVYGELPTHDLDHINGIKDDNRICNLREVSDSGNMQNMVSSTRRNHTGELGVSFDKFRNKFKSQIMIDGKNTYLGRFETKEQAHQVYLDAKRKYHSTCTI